jgi:hypothetical protein
VQDKDTLDALLCGDDADRASAELLGEVWRLLAPGGAYVMITSGERRGYAGNVWQSGASAAKSVRDHEYEC